MDAKSGKPTYTEIEELDGLVPGEVSYGTKVLGSMMQIMQIMHDCDRWYELGKRGVFD